MNKSSKSSRGSKQALSGRGVKLKRRWVDEGDKKLKKPKKPKDKDK